MMPAVFLDPSRHQVDAAFNRKIAIPILPQVLNRQTSQVSKHKAPLVARCWLYASLAQCVQIGGHKPLCFLVRLAAGTKR